MEELREKKLNQVRKILDKAADPATTPAEAAALREKADDLMLAYTISWWEAEQRVDKEIRQKPEWRYIDICGHNNPLKTQLIDLMSEVVVHCRCRGLYTGMYNQKASSKVHAVGFPSDLDYVEILFVSLNVQLAQELEPKPSPINSYVENLVMLKEAGLKWARVHELLHPEDVNPVTKGQGVKFTKLYTEYCQQHDRKRMYTSPQQYQRNYAEGFVSEVNQRMFQIRQHQKSSGLSGGKMELALVDEVKDAFAAASKGKGIVMGGRSKYDHAAREAGRAAGARADLGQPRAGSTKELT